MPNTISSRGKLYREISVWGTKAKAKSKAQELRNSGYSALVRPYRGNWIVYGRRK